MKRKIIPGEIPTKDLHQYIVGAVAPRPIAFVSTVDENGNHNLAPYSFFNAFSSNPPTVVFSSNRRVSNNTTKDTLHNIEATKECVISVVNFPIMRQMALTSIEYPTGQSEFDLTGLTPEPSDTVNVPRVKESPCNMECSVQEVITLGEHGGAGHLIICKVNMIHVEESVLDGDRIDPHKLDLVGRLGRAYYVRASGDAIMTLYQSVLDQPIGYAALPEIAKKSTVLSGNDIGCLAAITEMPSTELIKAYKNNIDNAELKAKQLIADEKHQDALALLIAAE